MEVCVSCGHVLPEGDRFCAKCGKQGIANPADAHLNYNDFGFCTRCKAVNLVSATQCRSCHATEGVAPLPGSYFRSKEFWCLSVAACFCIFFIPVSLICVMRIVYCVWRTSSKQQEARARIRQEAARLFENLKQDQILNARKDMERAITAFNAGLWQESYDLFLNSMLLGTVTPEQNLGAAVTAYNLKRYAEVLQHLEKCGAYRTEVTNELKARTYLHLGKATQPDLEWICEVAPTFPNELRCKSSLFVAQQWLNAPYLEEKIEKFFELVRAEWPGNPWYSEVLARLKILERKVDEAYAICASIPSDNHTEGSLGVYCEVLRKMADDSEQAFAISQRYWATRPGDIENTLYCVSLAIRRKEVGLAEKLIRQAIGACPGDHRLRYHLALVLKLSGRLPECIGELQELLRSPESEAYRSHEDVTLLMARCLVESGVYDAAVRQLQGITKKREVLDLLYEIGSKYSEAGKVEKANECWQQIYAVDVRFKDVLARISASSGLSMKTASGK